MLKKFILMTFTIGLCFSCKDKQAGGMNSQLTGTEAANDQSCAIATGIPRVSESGEIIQIKSDSGGVSTAIEWDDITRQSSSARECFNMAIAELAERRATLPVAIRQSEDYSSVYFTYQGVKQVAGTNDNAESWETKFSRKFNEKSGRTSSESSSNVSTAGKKKYVCSLNAYRNVWGFDSKEGAAISINVNSWEECYSAAYYAVSRTHDEATYVSWKINDGYLWNSSGTVDRFTGGPTPTKGNNGRGKRPNSPSDSKSDEESSWSDYLNPGKMFTDYLDKQIPSK